MRGEGLADLGELRLTGTEVTDDGLKQLKHLDRLGWEEFMWHAGDGSVLK